MALAACNDGGQPLTPVNPGQAPHDPVMLAALRCKATRSDRTVTCGNSQLPEGARGYIVMGGQHVNIDLTSSNVAFDAGTGMFTFDVTVKNLIPQALGTTDGVAPHADGVRTVFASGPDVTDGTGEVTVANADGTGTFTGSNQAYFQYSGTALGGDGILSTNETSSARNWALHLDPGVNTFTFTVWVVTEVAKPNGWVDFYPSTATLVAGDSLVATDSVRTATGKLVEGATVTFASSDTLVAVMDAAGHLHAVNPGSAVITATSGMATGTMAVKVCPNLAVGGVYTTTMPGAANVCFAGGASGAEYAYMPMNLSTTSSLASFGITASNIVAASGPPALHVQGDLRGLRVADEELVAGSDLPILERDRATFDRLMTRSSSRISRNSRGRSAPAGIRSIITQNVVPAIGDSMDLNTNSACTGSPSIRRGVVRSVSNHLIIVSDTANPAGGFTTAQYDSIALEFDTIAWPADSANFGPPTDVDGNGHVVAFFTRAVNELTPPNNSSYVLGFFASKDVFSNDPVEGCSNSNMGEMFYMLVPDITGAVNSNVRTVSLVRGNTTGTLGHEFQHMINAFRRAYVTGADFFESGYLNEGLSHIAEELMFYRASGMTPKSNVGRGTNPTSGVQLNSKRVAAYNAYMSQNIGRFRSWLQRPDTTGAFKNNANSLAVRGAIWSFLRYAADRTGGSEQTFWYNMVNDNLQGTANIQHVINATPTDWERDWIAALYADDNAQFTMASQYQNPSWNYRDLYALLYGTYSLQTRPLTNNTALTLTYSAGGSTAYMRFGVTTGGFANVTTSSTPLTPYSLVVVRTK